MVAAQDIKRLGLDPKHSWLPPFLALLCTYHPQISETFLCSTCRLLAPQQNPLFFRFLFPSPCSPGPFHKHRESLRSRSGGGAASERHFLFLLCVCKITLKSRCFHGFGSFRYLSLICGGALGAVIHTWGAAELSVCRSCSGLTP